MISPELVEKIPPAFFLMNSTKQEYQLCDGAIFVPEKMVKDESSSWQIGMSHAVASARSVLYIS